ncbi:beta-glucosidase BglX [Cupriavidus campinensis]|uniref:Periplasmic beta-glucosidase n=1 Tax=Cupriavidus campinensis TaxID=151783 RepID=A0AAE9L355_9BURK|nr:beta-glucosidase BglX [Cupriavidus campinensis]TSP13705.1 beta-glucosidase BglX [Cupriavidus campinensis]URF06657.1 beta-glucosidase BglX [Cupriavidus campinensis]
MRLLSTLALAASLVCTPALAGPAPAAAGDKNAFIADLIGKMTLEEKIGQLRLISIGQDMPQPQLIKEIAAGRVGGTFNSVTRADNRPLQDAAAQQSRLKIPIFFAYDVVHGHRTVFPISLGLASSWDMAVVEQAARISGKEASADGLDATFAPMVDISRDPRWGRTSEGFGEDPHLVSQCARASVRGFQGASPANPDSVMAFVKHFALYGAVEGGRDYNTVDMSPQRMYQDYLPPYRAGLDAGAGGVMIALNSVNGVPATSNKWLLRDLLRKEWGFKGVTVSDHGAIDELLRHGVADNGRQAARLAIEAGVDMSMADSRYLEQLPDLVKSGEVPVRLIDEAVREVLGAKYDMGLFQDPYRRIGTAAQDPADVNAESRLHRAEARTAARKSLVLLENRNQTLPLKKGGTVAVIGPLADAPIDIMGSWSAAGKATQSVTLLQGMRDALAGRGQVRYARGANMTDDERVVGYLNFLNWDNPEVVQDKRSPGEMIAEAVETARQADTIVVAVGESRGMSHEASSRTTLSLPGSQQTLLRALRTTGKPLVVVLMNGRPLTINWERDNADALLEAWYPGTEGGHAIADVLFGDENPSGKLPISFPRSLGQIPTYYNHLRIGRPFTPGKPPNYTSQYFEEESGPLYPFGYGLSYTTFSLSDVALSGQTLPRNGQITASVTVKNTGTREGETVVQLYIQDVTASVVRPVKELKDFRKVMLKPGESRVVSFPIGEDKLRFYNGKLEYVAEPGDFNVQVGLDSASVRQQRFTLQP